MVTYENLKPDIQLTPFLIITNYNLPYVFDTPRIYWYIKDFSTHLNIEKTRKFSK